MLANAVPSLTTDSRKPNLKLDLYCSSLNAFLSLPWRVLSSEQEECAVIEVYNCEQLSLLLGFAKQFAEQFAEDLLLLSGMMEVCC